MKYPEYGATQLARTVISEFDYENLDLPGKEYIEELDKARPFADKIFERAVALGYSGTSNDVGLRDFLLQLISMELGPTDVGSWKTKLNRWLALKNENWCMPQSRDTVYQLCFALKMNAVKTGEFFLKGYLERPYHFKELKETVYYYCLNNGLHYADAMALYQEAKNISWENTSLAETDTATIGRAVSDIHDVESFLSYIRKNRWAFETKSKSASNQIKELMTDCKKCAVKEINNFCYDAWQDEIAKYERRVDTDDGTDKNKNFDIKKPDKVQEISDEDLLAVIYGYKARREGGKEYVKTITKASHFPRLIRENLLANAQQLSALRVGNAPDTLARSTLILLNFYHFFSSARENGCQTGTELFQEFVDAMDERLIICGYGQLYWRNPYDWMIGYCAHAMDPIGELRDLIYEFFLSDESVYSPIENDG